MISLPYGRHVILIFWRQISSPHSNGMTFEFKVKYKWGRQSVVFSIKTACISETASDTAKVTIYRPLIATRIRAFDWYHVRWPWVTFEGHSAYVAIPTSNTWEIIYDTSTESEIANTKNHTTAFRWYDCRWSWRYFKVIRLSHQIARKRCVIRQKLL